MTAPTVMVVDDDRDVLDAIAMVLEISGYRAVVVDEAARALDLLRAGLRPSLIILDLMMPGMDGWAFRAAQRRDPAIAAIPVVVLSGDQETVRRAGDLDVAACVCKPIDTAQLVEMVERHRVPNGHPSPGP